VVSNSPEEFTAQIRDDLQEWNKLIQSARIKLD
jgi:tripartite-type tricarboxylate transporter receptor subunit TctC